MPQKSTLVYDENYALQLLTGEAPNCGVFVFQSLRYTYWVYFSAILRTVKLGLT